jgi:8-oxo-dGTP diphosphatase
MTPGWMTVVAGALQRADGLWLMHQRPPGKQHAGLWEFPGGKVEPNEMPVESLIRELHEELGIRCDISTCDPHAFAEKGAAGDPGAIVILLYTVSRWQGDPASLEGGAIGWFTPAEALSLAKPPLDVSLAQQLFQNC